jgi:hypothetical protein
MRLWDVDKLWKSPDPARRHPHYLELCPGAPRLANGTLIRLHQYFAPMEAELVERLNGIMTLRMYHQLPEAQRRDTLNRIAGAFAEAFGFAPIPPVMITSGTQAFTYMGMYGNGTIVLDPRGLHDLKEAVATTVHEAMHAYQRKIANRWMRREPFENEALAAVAQAWAYNFEHYLSSNTLSIQTYKTQPLEYHAFRAEERALAAMPWLNDPQRPVRQTGPFLEPDLGPVESTVEEVSHDWQAELLKEMRFQ